MCTEDVWLSRECRLVLGSCGLISFAFSYLATKGRVCPTLEALARSLLRKGVLNYGFRWEFNLNLESILWQTLEIQVRDPTSR